MRQQVPRIRCKCKAEVQSFVNSQSSFKAPLRPVYDVSIEYSISFRVFIDTAGKDLNCIDFVVFSSYDNLVL
jgi:hypothetical protein